MRTLPFAILLLAAPLAAQNPRASQQIDVAALAFDPSVATSGNLSIIAYDEAGTADVKVSVSDARGLTWSTPIKIDSDVTAARKDLQADSTAVVGNRVYVCWKDERNGSTADEIFFNYSTDGGATFVGDKVIDKGHPVLTGTVIAWAMAVSPDPGGAGMDDIYILIVSDPTGTGNDELYLSSSHDGGATFSSAVYVPALAAGTADIDAMALAADGNTVHVVFSDDRTVGNDDLFYQRSIDGGATFAPADVQIDTFYGVGLGDLGFDARVGVTGGTVYAAWAERQTGLTVDELRVAVSTDGGTTWGGDVAVGGYTVGVDDIDNLVTAATPIALYAAWEDNRSGFDEIYVASSLDSGATWTEATLSTTGGGFPRMVSSGTGYIAGVTWTGGAFPEATKGAYTWNGGNMWTGEFDISDHAGGDADFAEMAFNADYNNFVCAWLNDGLGSNNVYAGGMRNATLTVNGPITAGGPLNFDFDMFSFDSGGFAAVVASGGTATGSYTLPFGDGRDTGLLNDAIVAFSLTQIPGNLSGGITATGSGSTPVFNLPLAIPPIGTPLYFVGVGFGLGPVTLGNLTDVVEDVVQ